jgi:hypothetical protein
MSDNKKHSKEKPHSTHRLIQEAHYMKQAQEFSDSLNPHIKGYIALISGTFLFLFSLGFFMFFKLAIGFIGLGLMAFGIYVTGLAATLSNWFKKLTKRF